MQLGHLKTIHAPAEMVDGVFQKITALAWSPNNLRLAVATIDRYIILYDDNGDQKDKFSTKPGNKKSPRNYLVRALAFSPDSTKLAVAQSDNIVFIYKLGSTWGDKKTICNKFTQTSPVTSLCWPSRRSNEVVFGLLDGKMRIGILRNNKSATLYHTDSYVVSCAAGPDGQSFVSGHLDGSIYRYTFPDQDGPAQSLLTQTTFVPYCLGWGEHVCAAGNTGKIQFFDMQGRQLQMFDHSRNEGVKEFSSIAFNPSGQTVVLGNFDRFFIYVFNIGKGRWEEAGCTVIENLYTVTALAWKSDGSKLVTGSLCGAVDFYDACIRRYIYRGKYEFTYTSLSSVIVKRMSSGARMALKSRFGLEIKKINIYHDRYLVAHTPETLLMGDLQTTHLSEVPWSGSGKEKFYFDNEAACMVFNAGELSLVEYGNNEIIGSLRTEYMSPHLISLRLNEARNKEESGVKKIAFLLDAQAVRVLDLSSGGPSPEATYAHDCKIDWLELNQRATKLLFRDKRRALHLYDIASQTRITLLNFCNYVQWVPDSDVVVAQMRRQLCIYYSIDNPSDVTTINIKGDVEEIERSAGRTEVVVDEGINTVTYALDESLIAFGAAADGKQYHKAVTILESLPKDSPGAEAMWQQLSTMALNDNNLPIAQRCAAALGDVARAEFLNTLNNQVAELGGATNTPLVKSQLALINKRFKQSEVYLLQQGKIDMAIDMYRMCHKWDDALLVAESKSHPCVGQLRREYYDYLITTKQEEVAGDLKQREGDVNSAMQLYLKGGYPSKAADLVLKHDMTSDTSLTERVADALIKTKQYEKAGEFLEQLRLPKRALECYCRGHAYFRAVELARTAFPGQVVRLEEEWGDHLVSLKQMDAASIHYIQAGAYLKAINAAIEARQWTKAVQILDNLDSATSKPYYKRIAQHYAQTRKYADAEKYFIAGGLPQEAVQMYTGAGLWDKAHKIAVTYMPEGEVQSLYVNQAQLMESQGQFKEAERLYLTVNEPDLAISMYKKNRQYDDMIRLVSSTRKELLTDTHIHLASQFQSEGNLKMAEKHYIQAKEWKPVVSMYRENDMWEDCLRVAKAHGGQTAYKQVAYAFALSEGGDAGVKLLAKRGLGEQAVDYAMDRGEFAEAFKIAEKSCKHKLPEVHFQHAISLEDEGRFERAEEEFIKAKKPKEAIEMYIHQSEWEAAMRVAEQHEPAAIVDVQAAHGRQKAELKDYNGAEQLFVSAKKFEVAIDMYKDAGMWDDALRLAKKFATRLVPGLQEMKLNNVASSNPRATESVDYLLQQAKLLESQKNWSGAIDSFLKITKNHTSDFETLERAWENAVTVAMEHMHTRTNEVVDEVTRRFMDLNRVDQAAELCIGNDNYKGAIDCYLSGKMYDKARALAKDNAPNYMDYVERSYQGHLISHDKISELGSRNPEAAIEMHAQRDEWDQVFQIAEKQGADVVNKYASIQAKKLVGSGKYKSALNVFAIRGVAIVPANFGVLKRIAQEIFSGSEEGPITSGGVVTSPPQHIQQLRDVFHHVVNELRGLGDDKSLEFANYALMAHLMVNQIKCSKAGLKSLAAKNAVALLRYTMEYSVDRAFYEAGKLCKEAGWGNLAFVYLNRFVDVSDLIEDPDGGEIDNSDFLQTDIPSPFDIEMPRKQAYSEDVREEAREWVLDKAMSNDVGSASLNTRQCEKCNKETYEAGLTCHYCKHKAEICIVSGYPIQRHNKTACKTCKKPANKDDWNAYVLKFKTCCWCNSMASPVY